MVAKIENLIFDKGRGSCDAILVVIIRGTDGDTKAMAERIRKLEV